MKSLVFFFWITLLLPQVWSESSWVQRERSFDHEFLGCPANSLCPEKVGKLRHQWWQLLQSKPSWRKIESFRKKWGLPIGIWGNPKTYAHAAYWDSPCLKTRQDELMLGEAFLQKGKVKASGLSFDQILWQRKSSEAVLTVPKGEFPIAFDDQGFFFQREEQGVFYTLKSDWQQNWQVVAPLKKIPNFNQVLCPTKVQVKFQKMTDKNIYNSFFCRNISHVNNQETLTFIAGLDCQ